MSANWLAPLLLAPLEFSTIFFKLKEKRHHLCYNQKHINKTFVLF